MSNRQYDILNKFQRWLPLCGALYLAFCKIWGFPYGNEINQTIVAVASFLAATLEIATAQYNKNNKED